MRLRRDAGLVAGEVAVAVRRIAQELGGDQVGTVGSIRLHPSLVNVVAARAVVTVDLRNTDEQALQEAERRLAAELDRLAEAEGVTVTTRSTARFEPVVFDPAVVDLVAATAADMGLSVRRMPSGLRAQREGHQPQPGRVHRARGPGGRGQRLAPHPGEAGHHRRRLTTTLTTTYDNADGVSQ